MGGGGCACALHMHAHTDERIFFPSMLWCFDILKNLSGGEETATPWASQFTIFLRQQRAQSGNIPLICKLTNPDPWVHYLAHASQEVIFLCINHPTPGTKQPGLPLQLKVHWNYSNPVLPCLSQANPNKACGLSIFPVPIFCLLFTSCLSHGTPCGMLCLLSPRTVNVVNPVFPKPFLGLCGRTWLTMSKNSNSHSMGFFSLRVFTSPFPRLASSRSSLPIRLIWIPTIV